MTQRRKISFAAFFIIWADIQGWVVPEIHIAICNFLQHRGRHAVLMVFRGCGKSTLLAVYNAWCYYCDPSHRILHQGDQDGTAYKTARDTKNVLVRHPLTRYMTGGIRGQISFWWVPGNDDARNPSMQAAGILSNITSSRADQVQNDDIEVPKNTETPEAREKMRRRLDEQIHIAVPGAKHLFVGTPHTHDSIYEEQIALGADSLIIKMYEKEKRFEDTAEAVRYPCAFKPEIVFSGIHKYCKLMVEGVDYEYKNKALVFNQAPKAVIDCYAHSVWPERFTSEEMLSRRKRSKTLNYWDSQYQLHAKPVTERRLDPDKITPYEVEPFLIYANKTVGMVLGKIKIVGVAAKWDPSSGKLKSDKSVLSIVYQDENGRRYWHRSIELYGEVAEFDASGKQIIGGQVMQICEAIKQFFLGRVTVETNGIGGFAPAVLKAAVRQHNLICGVTDEHESRSKNKRILEGFEPVIKSSMLWAHTSVIDGEAREEMNNWNPSITDQPDDHLDAGSSAITSQPERIKSVESAEISTTNKQHNWRPTGGVHEVSVDY